MSIDYADCHRCGIAVIHLFDAEREFCVDCNYRDLIGVFYPEDYGYIFEGD